MKKKIILTSVIAVISVLAVAFLYFKTQFIQISPEFKVNESIGIIDECLSYDHSNVKQSNQTAYSASDKTHGDLMLEFLDHCSIENVYYFDASAETGHISADSLITGLEWMKANGVKYINISLSSKKKSQALEDWISENKNAVTIYASYNNLEQTFDYPAMYDDVIGSGSNKTFMNPEKDRCYISNKILMGFDLKNCYNGNSYLSLYSLISDLNQK